MGKREMDRKKLRGTFMYREGCCRGEEEEGRPWVQKE
jgi:hypothetical protein